MQLQHMTVNGGEKVNDSAVCSRRGLRNISLIAVATVLLGLPMLLYGPMPGSWDSFEHLNFAHHFSAQFWGGEWYPRWLLKMNHGLGSPTLFVYPPLPSYVYTLLEPSAKLFHLDAFRMGEFLALFGSGVFAFLWLNTMAGQGAALLGAILYMLMPYHLAINYYHRSALSECWALVWMPLVLYFTTRVIRQNGVSLVGFAFAYAMLILSHLVTVLMFSLIPLGLAIFLSSPDERLKSVLRVARGMLLGTGLSCFYLISAFSEAKYFPVSRLPLWNNLNHHFLLRLNTMLYGSGMIRKGSLAAASTIVVFVLCGIVVLAMGSSQSKRTVYFWLVPMIVSIWLMSSASAFVWWALPPLHAAVQYPGRFTIILCIASLPVIAVFLAEITRLPMVSRSLLFALLFLAVVPWFIAYRGVWASYDSEMRTPLKNPSVSDYDGWFLAWPVRGLDDASALRASAEPRVRLMTGSGTASAVLWEPRHIEIETNSTTGGELVVNQFYYPRWRAHLADVASEIQVETAMPEGIVKLKVPSGLRRVVLEIPVGPSEYIGRWISGLSVMLSLALVTKSAFTLRAGREPAVAVLEA